MRKNKVIAFLLTVLVASVALAGVMVVQRGMYSVTGTGSAAAHVVIPPVDAAFIVSDSFCLSSATNADVTVLLPSLKTTAQNTQAISNLIVYTDAKTATIGGYLPTSSDSVIVRNATNGYQVVGVASVTTNGVHTNNYMTLVLDGNIWNAPGDPVYIAKNADTKTLAGAAINGATGLKNLFIGKQGMPVALSIPATAGAVVMSGTVNYEK